MNNANSRPNIIVIDGVTYRSPEEMPVDVRQKYEAALGQLQAQGTEINNLMNNASTRAADSDGIADIFKGLTANIIASSPNITVNGQTYANLDQLPPEVRAKYEQAMQALDANQNGVPDFFEGMVNQQNQVASMGTPPPVSATSNLNTTYPATIEPEKTSPWLLVVGGVFILGVCLLGALGAWYFFLR